MVVERDRIWSMEEAANLAAVASASASFMMA